MRRDIVRSRVLTTNFTYQQSNRISADAVNRGMGTFSIAWVKMERADLPYIPEQLRYALQLYRRPTARELEICFRYVTEDIGSVGDSRRLFEALQRRKIIVQRSPETAVALGATLKNASAVTVGSVLGASAVGFDPMLMLVAVPGGVILMGSVLGVAKGLEKGLAELVHRYVAPQRRPAPRKARVRKSVKKSARKT
ncbi:hypothetical protein [Bradyrhizobium sp. AUGA SZCCT0431]|uniref:hypothetical protein n=1 Tax=Bradyrhizobium sp. AUGA SZCCT0431 TaxID=2807674 RepID=UPI001BA70022|nr:hypothetical protein [Bradyrhizobium sp. AUGA SZCCT0431]MBR1149024.1 hypothetical protein [Bradyrhizobium sp. AUGA SZCCT0431]